MRIDFHVHPLWDAVPEDVRRGASAAWLRSCAPDPGAHLLKAMDEAGFEISICLALEGKTGIYTTNATIDGFVRTDPKRLLAFANVDPLEPDAVAKLEYWVKERGFRGLKLHPSMQFFYPNDQRVYPLYEAATRLGIPVLMHTGRAGQGSRTKYALPIHLDDVALDFPDLPIVAAHCGGGFFEEMYQVALDHPNIHVECSGLFDVYGNETRDVLKRLLAPNPYGPAIGPERVIFGTDWPTFDQIDYVRLFESLDLSRDDLDKIFGENAAKLLKLTRD